MSKTLTGEWVGLKEIDDGIWSLYYGPVLLARFDRAGDKILWLIYAIQACGRARTIVS